MVMGYCWGGQFFGSFRGSGFAAVPVNVVLLAVRLVRKTSVVSRHVLETVFRDLHDWSGSNVASGIRGQHLESAAQALLQNAVP